MLEKSRQLVDAWNAAGIVYCHWKSNEHLEEGLMGETDLDVLLSQADRQRGCSILKEQNFLYCKSQYGSRYPGVEDWIGFDQLTGRLIHLHLHYQVVTGHKGMKEYNLPWSDEILYTRISTPDGVFIAEPSIEIVTLYTRIGLKASPKQLAHARKGTYYCGDDNAREIAYLKERTDWSRTKEILDCYYKQLADDMLAIMQKEQISSADFLRLVELTEKAMTSSRRYSAAGTWLRKWYFQVILRAMSVLKYRLHKPIILRKTPVGRGLVIAFIGQDGAGKSTVTKDIEKWLTWKLDASQFYLGSGDHFQPWEKSLQARLQHNNSPLSKVVRSWLPFRMLAKLGKEVFQTIRKASRYADKGGIAIFDRYPQNIHQGINDGPKIRYSLMPKANGRLLRTIAGLYAAREEKYINRAVAFTPDVVIKLMLTPEESIRRKPHENYEAVKQKHEIIKMLQFEGADVYTVDATQAYEQELIDIKNIIWRHIPK